MLIKKTRETFETKIALELNIYGEGKHKISTGIKFFDHMLEQLSAHANMDLFLEANSLDGDNHHIVEDVAIVLGSALRESLGDKKGIKRYCDCILPMDEALVLCAIDVSGRAYCKLDVQIKEERTSDFETVLLEHFFTTLANNASLTLHIKMLDGKDPHHIIECTFKSFAHALQGACEVNKKRANKIPSTKGVL